MAKAYSYTRFSTPEQMKGDSYRRQTEAAALYAATHSLELDTELTFEDLGVSAFRGRNAETGALGDFFGAITSGLVEPGSFLLVESLDRISRQAARKAVRILEDIVDAGMTVVTLNDNRAYTRENLDTDPTALLMALLIFIRANEESARKSDRLKAAWVGKRRRLNTPGEKPLTSIVPAWMKKVDERIVLIPERAAVVRRVVDMTLSGVGQQTIAETLNREGVPVFGRGDHWHRSYIKKICENEALVGTIIPHELTYKNGKKARSPLDPIPDYFPALVSDEEWARLSGIREGRKPATKGQRPLQNILAGLAKCARCGATMTRVQKGPKSLPGLVCTRAKRGAGCQYRSIPMWTVEGHVRGGLVDLVETYPSGDDNIDQFSEEVRQIELEVDILIDELIERGRSPALTRAREDAERRLEVAKTRLREAVATTTVRQKTRPDRLLELSDAPLEEVNAALRSLFREVRIGTGDDTGPVTATTWEWIRL